MNISTWRSPRFTLPVCLSPLNSSKRITKDHQITRQNTTLTPPCPCESHKTRLFQGFLSAQGKTAHKATKLAWALSLPDVLHLHILGVFPSRLCPLLLVSFILFFKPLCSRQTSPWLPPALGLLPHYSICRPLPTQGLLLPIPGNLFLTSG